jgi:hypothetical protein
VNLTRGLAIITIIFKFINSSLMHYKKNLNFKFHLRDNFSTTKIMQ